MSYEKHCPFKRGLRKVFCPWPSAHNVLMFLMSIFFLSLIDMDKGQWASWVQAVGSVAAIFTAVAIAHRDSSLRQKAELNARNGALVRALAVTSDAVDRVKSAFEAANNFGSNPNLVSTVTSHLEQCMRYLTEALSVQGLDSDIYAELFLARKSVEDAALLLPGIGHIETSPSESELMKKLKHAHQKLAEMQRSPIH